MLHGQETESINQIHLISINLDVYAIETFAIGVRILDRSIH